MNLDIQSKLENGAADGSGLCSVNRKDFLFNALLFSLLAGCMALMVWILYW